MSKLTEPVVRFSPSKGPQSPDVWGIYEPDTGSIQYVCADPASKQGRADRRGLELRPEGTVEPSTESMDQVLDIVREHGLEVVGARHAPARRPPDGLHLAQGADRRAGGIGSKVADIAKIWEEIYTCARRRSIRERDFDRLFERGRDSRSAAWNAGDALARPHARLDHLHRLRDAAFVHDTLMYPDAGTSRADFPGGNAEVLWDSIQAILALPGETRLFVGHDYGTDSRDEPMWEATVAEHKRAQRPCQGRHEPRRVDRAAQKRDRTLPLPDRILAALQINSAAGRLPPAEPDGRHYLKLPVNRF
jgi:hypothetical protein